MKPQEEALPGENTQNVPAEAEPAAAKLEETKPWNLPLRLFNGFIEALGRSSEEFYVYLPLADEPPNGFRSRKNGI